MSAPARSFVVLATDPAAIDPGLELPVPLRIHRRSAAHPDRADGRRGVAGRLDHHLRVGRDATRSRASPRVAASTSPFERVLPDLVLVGDGTWSWNLGSVTAGLFAGWVHAPAAFTVSMTIGAGRLVATTLRLGADNGPIARAMLADLVRSAASNHAGTTPGAGPAP